MTVMQFLAEEWEGEDKEKYVWNNLSAHFSRGKKFHNHKETASFLVLSVNYIYCQPSSSISNILYIVSLG